MLSLKKDMILETKDERIAVYLLSASVFFLPFFNQASLVIWAITSAWALVRFGTRAFTTHFASKQMYLFMVGLYVYYLIGMLWTEHYNLGWSDLGIKVTLLVFPFLFHGLPLKRSSLKYIGLSLIAGSLVAILICLMNAIRHYAVHPDINFFYYTLFSVILHPTYFTMYLNLSILFLIQYIFDLESGYKRQLWTSLFLLLLFFATVIAVNSRIAMLTTFATTIVYVIMESYKRKTLLSNLRNYLFFSVVLLGVFTLLLKGQNRFGQISEVIEKKEYESATIDTLGSSEYNSTTARIGLLKNGIGMFREHWTFGVGTGDVMPETVQRLDKTGFHYLAKKYSGAHNQYLQTAMTLGIVGLLLLLAVLFVPLYQYFRGKEYLFLAFMLIVIANAVGDTILRASSLYFFSFFGCYFYKLFKTERE